MQTSTAAGVRRCMSRRQAAFGARAGSVRRQACIWRSRAQSAEQAAGTGLPALRPCVPCLSAPPLGPQTLRTHLARLSTPGGHGSADCLPSGGPGRERRVESQKVVRQRLLRAHHAHHRSGRRRRFWSAARFWSTAPWTRAPRRPPSGPSPGGEDGCSHPSCCTVTTCSAAAGAQSRSYPMGC